MPKILVVDDELSILDMLSDLLEQNGYESETARDGRAALDRLESEVFDLILLDILIPHINGFELLDALSANPSLCETPVIVFSGIYRSLSHRTEAQKHPQVYEFLDKPLVPDRILESISLALQNGNSVHSPSPTLEAPSEATDDSSSPLTTDSEEISPQSIIDKLEISPHLIDSETEQERQEVEQRAESEFNQQNIVLQGQFEHHSLAEVLGKLWKEQASGSLLLRKNRAKKIIHIRQGNPYSVKSNLVHECLGQLLVQERLITQQQCEASIVTMRETGQKQGQILIDMSSITEKNLNYALELQFETKLFDIFNWTMGEYRFNPNTELPDHPNPTHWSGGAIVVEGIKRCFEPDRIQEYMRRFEHAQLDSTKPMLQWDELRFNSDEQKAYEQFQLPAMGSELIQATTLGEDATRRMIYSLIALRLLRPLPVDKRQP